MHIPPVKGDFRISPLFGDELSQITSMSLIHAVLCSVALEVG